MTSNRHPTSGDLIGDWDVVITPRNGFFDLRLGELWSFRDLVMLFIRRNFIVNYRQTIFGPLWYIAQPVATPAVFFIVFGLVASIPTDQIAPGLFFMSGIVMWSHFSANVLATADVFGVNMTVFGKVYFPRMTVPLATVLTSFVTLFIHLVVFAIYYASQYRNSSAMHPSTWLLASPLLFLANAALAMGFGLISSALTTRYRDLVSIAPFAIQLGMYVTPVIYPMSQVPEAWRLVAAINPMSTSIELFRFMLFGVSTVSMGQVLVSIVVGVAVVWGGLVMFTRAERDAADTI